MPVKRGEADMLEPIAEELEELGLPHEWVRCLVRGDDTIVYEDTQAELDAQQAGAWYDTWGDNGLHYPARVFKADGTFKSLTELSPHDAAMVLQELFHAWYDQCSTYGIWGTGVSAEEEENISSYLQKLLELWFRLRGKEQSEIDELWGPLSADAERETTTTLIDQLKESGLDFSDPPPSKSDLASTGQQSSSGCLEAVALLSAAAVIFSLMLF